MGSHGLIEPFFGVGGTSVNRQDAMTTVRIQMAVLCSVLTLLGCHQSMMQTQSNQPLGIAVQPVRNESGWGGFEGDRATDAVVERLARGGSLFVPPADRVRAALTDMGLDRARTPAELDRLADALGVQCILTVSTTSFDPYPPFVVGLEGVLHERRGKQANPLDPVRTDASPVDPGHNQPQLFKHSVLGVSSMPKMLTPPQTPKPGHGVEWDMTPRCVKWIRTSATPWIGCWRL